jgi:excisionase family DNA binding protein
MIDLAIETLLTIEKAAERLLVSQATLIRWITQGSSGIRLEAVKVGSRWRTSEEAIQRFSDRLTPTQESALQQVAPVRMSKERKRHLELVNQRLDEMFLIRRCETCKIEINAPGRVIPKHERIWCSKCLVKRKSATMAQRIRTFRWAAPLTQEELSWRTGISIENIRAYEANRKQPPEHHVTKLIEALGKGLISLETDSPEGDFKLTENPA